MSLGSLSLFWLIGSFWHIYVLREAYDTRNKHECKYVYYPSLPSIDSVFRMRNYLLRSTLSLPTITPLKFHLEFGDALR